MKAPLLFWIALVLAALVSFALGRLSGSRSTLAGGGIEATSPVTMLSRAERANALKADAREGSASDVGGGEATTFAGLADVLGNPSRIERERDLETLGALDFADGKDWRATVDGIGDRIDREQYLKGVVSAWAAEDPDAAIAYLETRSFATRCNLVPHAIAVWAENDPAAAERWTLAQPNGEVRDRSVESLYRSWAIDDPATAADRSLALVDGSARYRALVGVVQEWSANDLAAVEAWTRRLDDPNLKDFATMALADEMAARSPEDAMRFAGSHLAADASANPDIVAVVASKAGFESPQETFDWLQTLPPSSQAASSLAGVATYLAEADPDFAEAGFAELPPELKELAAAPVASVLGSRDPQGGIRWLDSLAEGDLKHFAASAFASGWAERDPAAADAWANSLPAGPFKQAVTDGLENADGEAR